eukprot:5851678-Prymnesium_polylepis.1
MRGATRASLVCCAGVAVCACHCRAVACGRRGVRGSTGAAVHTYASEAGEPLPRRSRCSSLVKGGRGCGTVSIYRTLCDDYPNPVGGDIYLGRLRSRTHPSAFVRR